MEIWKRFKNNKQTYLKNIKRRIKILDHFMYIATANIIPVVFCHLNEILRLFIAYICDKIV